MSHAGDMPAPAFPERLSLKAFAGEEPLPSAMFVFSIPTGRNAVRFVVGPADGDGELRLTRADLEAEFSRALSLELMDYGHTTGEVFVEVANGEMLDGLQRGYDSWRSVSEAFPADYLEGLDQASDALSRAPGSRLRVVCGSDADAPTVQAITRDR